MFIKFGHNKITKLTEKSFADILSIDELYNKISYKPIPRRINKLTEDIDNKNNMFAGYYFEIFIEFFCKYFSNELGIKNVQNIPPEEDLGVDLICQSLIDSEMITIQIKFKANSTDKISYKELSTFIAASGYYFNNKFRIPDKNLIVITNGDRVSDNVKKIVPNIRVINIEFLKNYCDHNVLFWENLNKSFIQSQKTIIKNI